MSCFTLHLDRTPPSLNQLGQRGHWRATHAAKKKLQEDLGWALICEGVPLGQEKVEASAVLRFPVHRPRDEGNFRASLEKALGDALTERGVIEDDTPDRYRFRSVSFEPERGPARTIVRLEVVSS